VFNFRTLVFFTIAVVAAFSVSRAGGTVLFAQNVKLDWGASSISDHVYTSWGYTGTSISVFNTGWTTQDIGKAVTIDASNDPNFGAFVGLLTDGMGELQDFSQSFGPNSQGGGVTLSNHEDFFLYNNGVGPQLQPGSVGSLTLTLNSLTLNSPGTNPNGNGVWTDVKSNFMISGSDVPEPAMAPLIILLGFTMSLRRDRKRIRSVR